MIRKFRKAEKHDKILKCIRPSPYLVIFSSRIASMQKDNGSWYNDPFLTAFALRALYECSKIFPDIGLKYNIRAGKRYLENELKQLSEEVLMSEDIYLNLDKNARTHSLLILVLSNVGKSKFNKNVLQAFERLEREVIKYRKSLGDMEIISQIVKCHCTKGFGKPPNELVEFLFEKLLLSDDQTLKLVILESLFHIKRKYKQLLENIWSKISPKHGVGDKDLWEYIQNTAIKLLENLENNDIKIEDLYYGSLVAKQLDINLLKKIGILTLKKAENLLSKVYSEDDEHFLYEFSLISGVLAISPFGNAMFISAENLTEIDKAIKWYEEKRRDNIIMLSKRKYNIIISSTFISFSAFIFILVLWLTNDLKTAIISGAIPVFVSLGVSLLLNMIQTR